MNQKFAWVLYSFIHFIRLFVGYLTQLKLSTCCKLPIKLATSADRHTVLACSLTAPASRNLRENWESDGSAATVANLEVVGWLGFSSWTLHRMTIWNKYTISRFETHPFKRTENTMYKSSNPTFNQVSRRVFQNELCVWRCFDSFLTKKQILSTSACAQCLLPTVQNCHRVGQVRLIVETTRNNQMIRQNWWLGRTLTKSWQLGRSEFQEIKCRSQNPKHTQTRETERVPNNVQKTLSQQVSLSKLVKLLYQLQWWPYPQHPWDWHIYLRLPVYHQNQPFM